MEANARAATRPWTSQPVWLKRIDYEITAASAVDVVVLEESELVAVAS